MKCNFLIGTLCLAALLATTSCKTTRKMQQTTSQESFSDDTRNTLHNTTVLPDSLLNGEWLFTEACGKPVIGDKTVQITFDIATSRIFGNNGCNVFNGALILGDGTALSFGECITTMMACRPEVTDRNVMEALNSTTHYAVTEQTKEKLTIVLLNSEGMPVATLSRQMRELLNRHWDIIEVDGKKIIDAEEMPSIVLDITTQKITGNSGCNLLNGTIVYDNTNVNNGIQFDQIASTRRMCSPEAMKIEDAVLNALNDVDAFRIINNTHIGLYRIPEKSNLLVLRRK